MVAKAALPFTHDVQRAVRADTPCNMRVHAQSKEKRNTKRLHHCPAHSFAER